MHRGTFPMIRLLDISSWAIPAALLAFSGLAKIISPHGSAPSVAVSLTELVPYTVLLRALGTLELATAGILSFRGSRRLGRDVSLCLLAAFSAFVAFQAHDTDFLRNCGCFGGSRTLALSGALGGSTGILLRNGALFGLILAGRLVEGRVGMPAAIAAGNALGCTALLLLAVFYVEERTLRLHGEHLLEAALAGGTGEAAGLPFPEMRLIGADGKETVSSRAVKGLDHLIFFSPHCPHCKDVARQWPVLARGLEARGARLVLVAVAGRDAVAAFKEETGCSELEHFVAPDPADSLRLGVSAVPHLMALDREGRICFNEARDQGWGVIEALARGGGGTGGFGVDLPRRMALALLGDGAECEGFNDLGQGVLLAPARRPDGSRCRIAIASGSPQTPYGLELAVGIDENGVISSAIVLAFGGYVRIVDPGVGSLELLPGRTVRDACAVAMRLSRATGLEAPIWRSLGDLLARLEQASGCS